MVYSGTCLTCAQKDPPSKVDREGTVMILPAPPLTSPPPERAHTISKYYGESNFSNTCPNTLFGVHNWTVGTPNMVKWGVPEKILQNLVQIH